MKTIRETPDFVCEKLIGKVPITDGSKILEPSVGDGKIVKYLMQKYTFKGLSINCFELNKERVFTASDNLYPFRGIRETEISVSQQDFLQAPIQPVYDIVIACPPFKANIDLQHIMKMYDMLKRKGILTTLTYPFWITNNEPLQKEFRKWLTTKEYQFEMLPDNTFKEKDKNQPAAILTIYKK
jgi:phospholipid N-methyltransferase